MARAIQASDIGPDVLYHLGSNPKDAARISRLDPILQAREIGKIEAQLGAAPPVKKTSNALLTLEPPLLLPHFLVKSIPLPLSTLSLSPPPHLPSLPLDIP